MTHTPATANYLTNDQVAEKIGVTPAAWRAYNSPSRQQAPPPDLVVGGKRLWLESTIEEWQATRPGRGRGPRRRKTSTPA